MLLLLLAAFAQQPDTVRLPDVVTTASRLASRPGTVTASTTVLSGADLRERGVVFLIDALRDVPGLVVAQTGSYGAASSVFLRGGESDHVKVLVDGVPMNAPGGAFNFANLLVENVDRIEIIRGPASVVHGADAMTGVIQVFTRPGRDRMATEIDAGAGGLGGRRLSGAVRGTGRTGALSVQAGVLGSDGQYAFNSAYRQSGISARLATAPTALASAGISLRYGDSRAHFPTNSSGALADSNQFTIERQLSVGTDLSRSLGRIGTLGISGFWGRTDSRFRDRLDHPGDTTGFGFMAARSGRTDRSGADIRLTTALASSLAVVVGGQYEDERQRQTGSTTSNFGVGIGTEQDQFRATRSTTTAYGEVALDLVSGVTLTGGGRVDENSAFGTLGSWRLGGTARLGLGTRLRAQVGRAFKAPTFPELLADSPFEVGNPELLPERASSWEVGVDQALTGGRVLLSVVWFDQRFRELIEYVSANPGEPTYANIAAATSQGLEATLRVHPAGQWSLHAAGTLLRTRITASSGGNVPVFETGESLVRRPELTASAGARFAPSSHAVLRLDFQYLGEREDADFGSYPGTRVTLPARTIADLAVTGRLSAAMPGLEVTLRIENLFDQQWQQVLGFPGRGRLATIGLRVGG